MKQSQETGPALNDVSSLIDDIVFADAILARHCDSVTPQSIDDPSHWELLWCRSKREVAERESTILFQSLRVFYSSSSERDLIIELVQRLKLDDPGLAS